MKDLLKLLINVEQKSFDLLLNNVDSHDYMNVYKIYTEANIILDMYQNGILKEKEFCKLYYDKFLNYKNELENVNRTAKEKI